jgi:hypothetical protein
MKSAIKPTPIKDPSRLEALKDIILSYRKENGWKSTYELYGIRFGRGSVKTKAVCIETAPTSSDFAPLIGKARIARAGRDATIVTHGAMLHESLAAAQELVFLSTQLRPIDEAQKVREVILKGAPKTAYVVDEPSPFTVRMRAEQQAGKRTVSLVGALHGELQPLLPMDALDPIDDVAAKLAGRGIPAGLMQLGRFGTDKQ